MAAAAAAALTLASPLRRLLRAPHPRGVIPAPYYFITRRWCSATIAVAAAAARDSAVKGGVDRNAAEAEEVRNILDMKYIVVLFSLKGQGQLSSHLRAHNAQEAMLAIEKLADIKAVAQGGYPQAERCRISVGHPDSMTSNPDVVAALSISGNFRLEPCSHGDFLGAILGTGITREKGERGAQVLVDPELVDYLISTLEKVGKVGVSCTQIPLLALEYEPPRTKSFKTVESSLRVDALASAGFKISRTKLASLISAGDVRVNWAPVLKNGVTLKSGDVVSVSGMGRLKDEEKVL
ncbi:hypothetical protein C2845_PM07G22920 [Panicum miliaceum]|uniref:RNA-binding S4 domain-containing protein n=1 Tax=Panicum miliaceum TaxID=4540 RepID=A0A3L6SPE0_PANMI|nr:hypothetical protein C2845_PM07G22920 [Panicum miliaceum]